MAGFIPSPLNAARWAEIIPKRKKSTMTTPAVKIATVKIATDTEVARYGVFLAGYYRVAMPAGYDASQIDAYGIVHDTALTVVTEETR